MLSQCWVNHEEISLAAVVYQPEVSKFNTGVLLVSGFSQSMCDNDFFMAKLARRLASEGLYVLQVDPRGHGDSTGNLEEVTLATLREDLGCAVQFAMEQSGAKMIGVGRGLSALLMEEELLSSKLCGVAGVNPYYLDPAAVKDLFPGQISRVVDTSEILTGYDYKRFTDFDPGLMAFFDALGAGILINFLGQKVSGEIIRELMRIDPDQVLRGALAMNPEARFWLMPDGTSPTGMVRWTPERPRSIREYQDNPFPGNPWWHHQAIESITAWIIQKTSTVG